MDTTGQNLGFLGQFKEKSYFNLKLYYSGEGCTLYNDMRIPNPLRWTSLLKPLWRYLRYFRKTHCPILVFYADRLLFAHGSTEYLYGKILITWYRRMVKMGVLRSGQTLSDRNLQPHNLLVSFASASSANFSRTDTCLQFSFFLPSSKAMLLKATHR